MKRHTLSYICMLLIVATSSIMPVQAQQQSKQYALYNYRNDGDFNAWLNIDIDSITYSCIDTLGMEHDEVVVQEVWTPDSLYRIPIEAIDSIGFRAPEPVYKSGVFHITEDHCPYVIDTDSLSITFHAGIPFSMLPQRGQIVISDVYGKTPFESGFAGRVRNIINNANTIKIECDEVSIDDIYDQIICVGRTITYSSNDSTAGARKISINKDGTLGIELLPIKIKLKDPNEESSDLSINLDITPSMSLDYTIIYNVEGMDNHFKIVAKPQLDFDIDFKYKSKLFGDKILKMEDTYIPINTSIPGLYAKLKWGGFFDYEGNLSIDGKLSYKAIMNVGYDSAKEDYYGFVFNNDGSGWEEPDVSLSMNGYIFFGPAFQLVACLVSEKWMPSFTVTAKPGCKLSGKFEINDDMFTGESVSVYDALKNSKVSCSGELKIEGEAKVFSEKYTLPSTEWKPEWLKQDFYLFPEFSEADLLDMSEIDGTEYSPAYLYSEVSRNLFLPCKIGMAVYDLEGNKVREHFNEDRYWFEKDWSKFPPADRVNRVGVNMRGLTSNTIYKVCPLVKSALPWFDTEQASPTTYFQIPLSLELEQSVLNLGVGQGKEISIYRGWGDYKVINMNPDIVNTQLLTHELESGAIVYGVFVEAKTTGHAFVIVQDVRSNEQVTLSVNVEKEPILQSTIYVNTNTIDFGAMEEGEVKTQYFSVVNSGDYDLKFTVGRATAPFSIPEAGTEFTLPAGDTKVFAVTCNGLKSGDGIKSQFIPISSDASNASADFGVTLKAKCGNATTSAITVSPTEIDFGGVEFQTTKTRELKVTNTGDKNLTFHVNYQGSQTFSVSDNGKEYTLNPGDFKIYTITCQGMMKGEDATGAIEVVTTADNGNQTVKLTAQGAAPTTFTLEKNAATTKVGTVAYVNILYGSKDYGISNNNTDVVSVVIDTEGSDNVYGRVKLVAMDEGQAVVRLTDRKTNKAIDLTVTVKEDDSPYITFADKEVERICLNYWDTNGDGKLSKTEAAAVTDLEGAFMYNDKIRSFAEFRYFTGVTTLDFDFYECYQLRDIVLPRNLKEIYWNVFYDCGRLKSIHIPQNVSNINCLAFQWCHSLASITVSPGNAKYDSRNNCNAIIESETDKLNNGFSTTIIPSTVTIIGTDAFWGQDRLSELSIPSSVVEIESGAFGFCDLKEVTIPASVVNIGGGAFGGCYKLKKIAVAAGNSVYDSRENCNAIINSHTNELMQGCKNTTIPSSVTSIADGAFQWQYYLESITIPESLKSIKRYAFYNCSSLEDIRIPANVSFIGPGAFGGCSSLSEVIVSSQNTKYDSRNNSNAIVETATNTLVHANQHSQIPDDITSIGDNALAGYKASSLILPEGVTTINTEAFRGSTLKSLTLPSTLKSLGDAVFWECEQLNDVVCYAKEVPSVWSFDWGEGTFKVSQATLHVPAPSVDSYRNSWKWQDFGNIVALPEGTIKVDPTKIDFGTLAKGESKAEHFTVTNTGEGILAFHLDFSGNDVFEVSDAGKEFRLSTGEEKAFTVTCHLPENAGLSSSNAVIWIRSDASNADEYPLVNLTVSTQVMSAEAIDLGLPSGTRWASYNVGATKPEEYGGYYAWGETEEKNEYTNENYLHEGKNLGSSISGTEYDVAHVKWGGNWLMPTRKQVEELINKCSHETVEVNGVTCMKFVGQNGNTIIMPMKKYEEDWGTECYSSYWSGSSNASDENNAYNLFIDSDGSVRCFGSDRFIGRSVRPVETSFIIPPSLTITPEEGIINFGTVKSGTDKTETFTVTNTGNSNMTFHVDGSTQFTSFFEVSDNLTAYTLTPSESKIYTVTAHGINAGNDASTVIFVKADNGEEGKVKLLAYGDDDEPLIDKTSLILGIGEHGTIQVKTSHFNMEADADGIVDYMGGGLGESWGPTDNHDSFVHYSQTGITFTALKPGVVHITFKNQYSGQTAVLTITVTDGSTPDVISITPAELDFGEVEVGRSGNRYLTFINNGDEQIDVTVEGESPYSVKLLDGHGRPGKPIDFSLDPGSQRLVRVEFSPRDIGDYASHIKVTLSGAAGGERNIPVHGKGIVTQEDPSFHFATNTLELFVNDDGIVEIYNGSGNYELINDYPDIVGAEIHVNSDAHARPIYEPGQQEQPMEYDWLDITGKKVGTAILKVKDTNTGEMLSLNVEVKQAPPLSLSASTVELTVGEEDTSIEIQSGSGLYKITSDHPEVATASETYNSVSWVDEYGVGHIGKFVKINALSVGQTTITIKDLSSLEELTIAITVTGGSTTDVISVTPTEIDFGEVEVGSYEARYLTISNNGNQKVTVVIKEESVPMSEPLYVIGRQGSLDDYSVITIQPGEQKTDYLLFGQTKTGEYRSNIIVTSEDLEGWKCVVPAKAKCVEKQPEDPSFHLSTNSIEVCVNDYNIVEIHNGSGDYEIINDYPDIVESDINGVHIARSRPMHDQGYSIPYDMWYITGKKVGTAILKLKDNNTNEMLTLNVEVKQAPPLSLSASSVKLSVGEEDSSIEIKSGSGWYSITSDNPEIATATKTNMSVSWVDENGVGHGGTFVTIRGLRAGNTKVMVKDMSSEEITEINVTVKEGPYLVYKDKIVTFFYDGELSNRDGEAYSLSDYDLWLDYCDFGDVSIEKVIFDPSFAQARPTTTARWFSGMTELETIVGIEYLNTSQVTDMERMFHFCPSLKSLDLSHFDTSNVMDMSEMFSSCSSLTSLDVSHFDTSNVTDMSSMFNQCYNLESINLGNLNTSNVKNMYRMFANCYVLKNLDVSHFNTSKVKNMGLMFWNCKSLTSLDISNFNTSIATNMENMFSACESIQTIYCSNLWDTSNVIESGNMFEGSTKLVGGKGTVYDANHTDAEYARIDGGPDSPGYFTDISTIQQTAISVTPSEIDLGVAIQNHKKYDKNAVLDFSREKME